MGKKVFVSYKYADSSVKKITSDIYKIDTVRDYVDYLEVLLGRDNIYKGEHDSEDLSNFTAEWTWTTLKEKIFDSSVTIVLISPNMKEIYKNESSQWIPQEVSYSLKEISHNGRYSKTNALLYVVLPDTYGNYNYYMTYDSYSDITTYHTNVIFEIMSKNILNKKQQYGKGSYAVTVKWEDFINNYNNYIKLAVEHQDNIGQYNIVKMV